MLRGVGLDFELPTAKSGSGIEVSPADIGFNFGTGDPTADTGLDFGTDEPTKDTGLDSGTEEPTKESDGCPQVWYDISNDLKRSFSGCNQLAANAIRFAFHDAGRYIPFHRTGASHD